MMEYMKPNLSEVSSANEIVLGGEIVGFDQPSTGTAQTLPDLDLGALGLDE